MQEPNPEIPNLEQLQKTIYHTVQKLQRKLDKQQKELDESAKHLWFKQLADSILASPEKVIQKESKITVYNIYTQKEEQIPVNPKLDVQENAQLLYKKAKKAKRGEQISAKKVEATKDQLRRLLALDKEIKSALQNKDDVENQKMLLNKLEQELTSIDSKIQTGAAKIKPGVKKVPFHHFVTDGWEFFIGKSDTQNDELSIHFAHPSDIWLHVAGYAGSHVIIRRPKDKPYPQPEVLKKAAALAIWFSKAKHTSFSEVHYTEARFVRKRKHAPAGEVIAERCKTIRVAPKSPQDLFRTPFLEDSAAEV